ncbi:MAG: hypothetical protein P8Y23_05200 [Candidatus Lokiarchaeota archaeon]
MISNNEQQNLILGSHKLKMLLNELFIDSSTKFSIFDCLYGLKLFEVNIGDKIEITIHTRLNDIQEQFRAIPNQLIEEYPTRADYFEIFVKSGFYFKDYENKFDVTLNKIEAINVLEGDMLSALAFDTNLYYDQIFTQFSKMLRKRYKIPKYPINFLVSEGVRKELLTYEAKYKNEDIEDLKGKCADPDLIEDFWNQNKLNARIKHLAHTDYLKCFDSVYSKLVQEDTTIENADMDTKIIEGLAKEIRQQRIKLYLFSQDKDFISRARGIRNIIPIYLEKIPFSKLKDKITCGWGKFSRFLYILAITFGVITLQFGENENMQLYGIWRGKGLNDWENENVKLSSNNPILKKVEKDYSILKSIKLEEDLNK